jgi:hypothetical protein
MPETAMALIVGFALARGNRVNRFTSAPGEPPFRRQLVPPPAIRFSTAAGIFLRRGDRLLTRLSEDQHALQVSASPRPGSEAEREGAIIN